MRRPLTRPSEFPLFPETLRLYQTAGKFHRGRATLRAEFLVDRLALLVYWGNLLLLGAVLYASWGDTIRARLEKDDLPADVPAAICRRIVVAQGLYAAGALLCFLNTYLSIVSIMLVQLNYAVAPRPEDLRPRGAGGECQGLSLPPNGR